jgi:hypothetical protein
MNKSIKEHGTWIKELCLGLKLEEEYGLEK